MKKTFAAILMALVMASALIFGDVANAAPKSNSLPIVPVSTVNGGLTISYDATTVGATQVDFICTNASQPSYSPVWESFPNLPPSGTWTVYDPSQGRASWGVQEGHIQCQGRALKQSGPSQNPKLTRVAYIAYWDIVV